MTSRAVLAALALSLLAPALPAMATDRVEPAAALTRLRSADGYLLANKPAQARDQIEAAETALMNAMTLIGASGGMNTSGEAKAARAAAGARQALAGGDIPAARMQVGQAIKALAEENR